MEEIRRLKNEQKREWLFSSRDKLEGNTGEREEQLFKR